MPVPSPKHLFAANSSKQQQFVTVCNHSRNNPALIINPLHGYVTKNNADTIKNYQQIM